MTNYSEYKIEILLTPHPWDNQTESYFWCILGWFNSEWVNTENYGWATTPQEAFDKAIESFGVMCNCEDGCEDISDLVPLLQQRLESFHNDMLQSCQCDEDRQLEKLDYENYLTYLKLLENHQFNEAQRLFQEMDTQAREILHHIFKEVCQRQKQKQQLPKNKYEYESTNPFEIVRDAKKRYKDNPTVENWREYEARRQDLANFRNQLFIESRSEREAHSQTIDRER